MNNVRLRKSDGQPFGTPLRRKDGSERGSPRVRKDGQPVGTPKKRKDGQDVGAPRYRKDGSLVGSPFLKKDGTPRTGLKATTEAKHNVKIAHNAWANLLESAIRARNENLDSRIRVILARHPGISKITLAHISALRP